MKLLGCLPLCWSCIPPNTMCITIPYSAERDNFESDPNANDCCHACMLCGMFCGMPNPCTKTVCPLVTCCYCEPCRRTELAVEECTSHSRYYGSWQCCSIPNCFSRTLCPIITCCYWEHCKNNYCFTNKECTDCSSRYGSLECYSRCKPTPAVPPPQVEMLCSPG